MAKGDKKKQFMERTGKTEEEYYRHSKKVCEKRHFNMRITTLLKCYGFEPLKFMEEKSADLQPKEPLLDRDHALWLVQDCRCPVTLLNAYLTYYSDDSHEFTKEAHIARLLRKFPEESFRRFGDINLVDKKFFKIYANERGMAIDVQAMEMSEISGLEITEQDIVDIYGCPSQGQELYKPVTMREKLQMAYYQVTGMSLPRNLPKASRY